VLSIFNQQLINLYQLSRLNQQLINQLLINLLFASLRVSKLVLILFTVPPWTNNLPSTMLMLSTWGGPANQ